MDGEFVAVGVPGRTPAAAHHFLTAYFRPLEAGVILDKVVVSALRCSDCAFIGYGSSVKGDIREILYSPFVLIVKAVLLLDKFGPVLCAVSTFKVQAEHLSKLPVGLVRAPSA